MVEKLTLDELDLIVLYRQASKGKKEQVKKLLTNHAIEQYTLTEVQNLLGVSYKTALGYVRTGKLKAVRVGGKWKVNREDFDAFAYNR